MKHLICIILLGIVVFTGAAAGQFPIETDAEDLLVSVIGCEPIGDELRVYFTIESLEGDQKATIHFGHCKAYDGKGNVFASSGGAMGDMEFRGNDVLTKTYIEGLPIKGELRFKGGIVNESSIKMLRMKGKVVGQGLWWEADFRNVPISDIGPKNPFDEFKIAEDATFRISEVKARSKYIEIEFMVTSQTPDKKVALRVAHNKIYDDKGNEYLPVRGELGEMWGGPTGVITQTLAADVPLSGKLRFDAPGRKLDMIEALRLSFFGNEFTIKNIPLK